MAKQKQKKVQKKKPAPVSTESAGAVMPPKKIRAGGHIIKPGHGWVPEKEK